ncbi:hypothetical protein CA11_29180 [Gimesia maris]|uniref:hypothetical protein n=1 Tax=Gimesia maris TaxID=122 RepID=UPI00118C0393|nr:hypothetical protein [Gimesia maris]QDU15098.1 hypothetical protein CA11_29180 [Gimesia maris]
MIMTNATAKIDPFTLPCWRWEVAEQLFNEPDRDEIPEDQITRDVLTYLKTWDTSQFPEIHTSLQIFQEDGLRRAELEARILCGQSDSEIAGFCKCTPEVVQVYADLFFCVRDFSHASDWLLKHAVGQPHFYGYGDHNLRQMWNWFGLMVPNEILNWVIQSYYDELKPDDKPTLSIYLRPASRVDLGLQVLIAESVFPNLLSNDRWEHEFMDYFNLTQELPTTEERMEAVQIYKRDRIKFAYLHLMGKIKNEPCKRKPRKTARRSPAREISKIRQKLQALESKSP